MRGWVVPLFVGAAVKAHAGATFTAARFTSCGTEACTEVRAAEGSAGTLYDGMYFKNAVVKITDRIPGRGVREYQTESLYYDVEANELQLRGVKPKTPTPRARAASGEAFIDLRDGLLHEL